MKEPIDTSTESVTKRVELLRGDYAADGAGFDASLFERLVVERDALKAQLPEGMKHCTIVFKECEKGHGWLTSTNWVQHDCPTCERDALKAENERLKEALTPSAATKASYIGEIKFYYETEAEGLKITVPWTSQKDFMKMILARAALAKVRR